VNWVDYVLLVLVALSAVHGLRLGAANQVLSFGGLLLGLYLGFLIAPSLAGLASGSGRTVIALAVVFGMALLLGGLGRLLGARSSQLLHRLRLGPVDSAFGVAAAVVATLVATWIVASPLSNSRFTTLDNGLTQSRIIRALDNVLPPIPTVFSSIQRFLDRSGFPVVFAGLPPQAAGPVTLPSDSAERTAVVRAAPSTVQVSGAGCGVIQEGSAFVVAPGVVVTNAHVVAGVASPQVIDTTGHYSADTVLFDPALDIAVLRVRGLNDPALPLYNGVVGRGTTGVVLGYPLGGGLQYGKAGVEAAFSAVGLDIYGRSSTTREVYGLGALVQPGNSGGPVVASGDEPAVADGTVIGVVFARSTTNNGVGYALAMPAVDKDISKALVSGVKVSTGACVS
jgi:hypothetical protein